MIHELKIWPQYYARVADGTKTFEVRNNDRGFQPGDTVTLREWDPTPKEIDEFAPGGQCLGSYTEDGRYTRSPTLAFRIGYVLPIENSRVVFSLLPLVSA